MEEQKETVSTNILPVHPVLINQFYFFFLTKQTKVKYAKKKKIVSNIHYTPHEHEQKRVAKSDFLFSRILVSKQSVSMQEPE